MRPVPFVVLLLSLCLAGLAHARELPDPDLRERDRQRLDAALAALEPQRPGQPDLYAIGFGGDSEENVFRNEAAYFERLMNERFGAKGRTLALINHADSLGPSPHPLATLTFNDCRVPASGQLGVVNGGFKLAMQTLDIFRASVAGAALGFARRALAEAVAHAKQRRMFGQTLADFQLTQAKLGEMAALVDAAALLTYRAAWLRDDGEKRGGVRVTAEAAMAETAATENAQRVIDMALQMHGGLGVKVGTRVESLYRDIRSLRIYEGATEVQQLIIGKAVLKEVFA